MAFKEESVLVFGELPWFVLDESCPDVAKIEVRVSRLVLFLVFSKVGLASCFLVLLIEISAFSSLESLSSSPLVDVNSIPFFLNWLKQPKSVSFWLV